MPKKSLIPKKQGLLGILTAHEEITAKRGGETYLGKQSEANILLERGVKKKRGVSAHWNEGGDAAEAVPAIQLPKQPCCKLCQQDTCVSKVSQKRGRLVDGNRDGCLPTI